MKKIRFVISKMYHRGEFYRQGARPEYMIKTSKYLTLFFMLVFIFPSDTFGYIDPNIGSYVFQLLFAALLGGLLTLKLFYGRIKLLLKRLFSNKKKLS